LAAVLTLFQHGYREKDPAPYTYRGSTTYQSAREKRESPLGIRQLQG
jgi:hypothetical protein